MSKSTHKRLNVLNGRPMMEGIEVSECAWKQDEDGNWETSCGEMFIFNDGEPKENGFQFCPYCGNPIGESDE